VVGFDRAGSIVFPQTGSIIADGLFCLFTMAASFGADTQHNHDEIFGKESQQPEIKSEN
jgi:hypothetical protein